MKFTFADGETLGVYEDGKVQRLESAYINKYRENVLRDAKSREWKKKTDVMMSEEYYFEMEDTSRVEWKITGISPAVESDSVYYSFWVNETSAIYKKNVQDKEKTESHFLSSSDMDLSDICLSDSGEIVGVVQTRQYASDIAVFSKNGGDYKCVTAGDSLDENPSFTSDGKIVFNSYAVCRDGNNNFVGYMPSDIYRLDPVTMNAEPIISERKLSYIKPVMDSKGRLYCISKPDEKKEGNVLLDILLIPVRIVQAIVGFIAAFVTCFAQKPLVSGSTAKQLGDGETSKGKDGKKVKINNHLLNVEKQLQRNKKYAEGGFIPRSWKLLRIDPDENGVLENGTEYELAHGVADFCLIEEDGKNRLIYTNGKHIFCVHDMGDNGKKEKLLDTDFCLQLGALCPVSQQDTDDGFFSNL